MAYSEGILKEQEGMYAGGMIEANPQGNLIFVNSQTGSDGKNGGTPRVALKTLTAALAKAVAGDTIILDKGGSETITSGLTLSVDRVKIICPTDNPRAGYSLSGAGTLDLITVSSDDCHIEGIQFKHTGATANASGILGSATADRLTVRNCAFDDTAIATTKTGVGVELTAGGSDRLVEDCIFLDTKYGVQIVASSTNIETRPLIKNNEFFVGGSAFFGIFAAAATGSVQSPRIAGCEFHEADGDGTSATAAWNGTDGTNATQGPISFGANVDQYLIYDCVAYTALTTSFKVIQAINAGAAGDIEGSLSGQGGDTATAADCTSSEVVINANTTSKVTSGEVVINANTASKCTSSEVVINTNTASKVTSGEVVINANTASKCTSSEVVINANTASKCTSSEVVMAAAVTSGEVVVNANTTAKCTSSEVVINANTASKVTSGEVVINANTASKCTSSEVVINANTGSKCTSSEVVMAAAVTSGEVVINANTTAKCTSSEVVIDAYTSAACTSSEVVVNANTTAKCTSSEVVIDAHTDAACTSSEVVINANTAAKCTSSEVVVAAACTSSEVVINANTTAKCTSSEVVIDAYTAAACTSSEVVINANTTAKCTSSEVVIDANTNRAGRPVGINAVIADNTVPNNVQTKVICTATTGACWIEEIILAKDGTNFDGPTNVEITTDNAYGPTGATNLFANVKAGLAANLSLRASQGGVQAFVPMVLEAGKKLYIEGSDGAGSSAGNIRITVKGCAMADGAYLA